MRENAPRSDVKRLYGTGSTFGARTSARPEVATPAALELLRSASAMAPPRRLLLLLLLLLALVLGLFRVDGFFVGAAGKGRFGGQRVRLAASQPDEPLGGLRPRGRLLRPFPASRRPALAASVLLATCLSLNTLQPSKQSGGGRPLFLDGGFGSQLTNTPKRAGTLPGNTRRLGPPLGPSGAQNGRV